MCFTHLLVCSFICSTHISYVPITFWALVLVLKGLLGTKPTLVKGFVSSSFFSSILACQIGSRSDFLPDSRTWRSHNWEGVSIQKVFLNMGSQEQTGAGRLVLRGCGCSHAACHDTQATQCPERKKPCPRSRKGWTGFWTLLGGN